ncbi:MAG: histidine phosphatase family protein [Pseudomonadota bacterium]
MSLRLTLIAHGATQATRAAAFPRDEQLEPASQAKAAALRPHLGRVDGAWTSPARRAVETAEALGLAASIDPRLADIDLGTWAGRSLAEVEAADAAGLARWMEDPASTPHGGESVAGLMIRAAIWLDEIGRGNGRIVAVTHAAFVRAVAIVALNADPKSFWRIDIEPLSFSRFLAANGRWTLRSLNAGAPQGDVA